MGECCCGCGTTTTTLTTYCTTSSGCTVNGVPVLCPTVQATVTADDADLPVSWCGITWLKSTTAITDPDTERHSGESAAICPIFYRLETTDTNIRREHWKVGTGGPGENYLKMTRYWCGNCTPLGGTIRKKNIIMLFGSNAFRSQWSYNSKSIYSNLGIGLSAVALPESTDYRITDAFFSSITSGGVTYTWARGPNW